MKNETHPNTKNMTEERLHALQEVRDEVQNLWKLLVESNFNHYDDRNLAFLNWDERTPARVALRELGEQITLYIHGELGALEAVKEQNAKERYQTMKDSYEETVGIMEEVRNVS